MSELNQESNQQNPALAGSEILDATDVLVTGVDGKQYRRLGKIRDAHGIRGELYLISYSKSFDWIHESSEFHLVRKVKINPDKKDSKTREVIETFEVQKVKRHKVGVILKLKGIESRNDAELYKGAVLQLEESIFQEVKADGSYYLAKLQGFIVYNEAQQNCGTVISFSSNGAQDLLEVKVQDQVYTIPYVDELIIKKNFKESWISMRIPEGLIDVENLEAVKELDNEEDFDYISEVPSPSTVLN